MRAASGMSRTIDRRRPWKLTATQRSQIDHHPEVKLLRRRQLSIRKYIRENLGPINKLKGTALYGRYQKAYHTYRNTKRRHEESFLKEIKAKYKREQPVIDIQRQLKGLPVIDKPAVDRHYVFTERSRAINALFTFATASAEEAWKRRSEAINSVTALCSLRGAERSYRRSSTKHDQPSSSPPPTLPESLPFECQPTQCIFCLGNDKYPIEKRLKCFHSRGDLKKHLYRSHLKHHGKDQPIDCPHPRCSTTMDNEMYFRNHLERIHKVQT